MSGTRLALLAGLAVVSACKRTPPPEQAPAPTASAPVDHLAKGELPEGKGRAFTLPLPLRSEVRATFDKSVHVASTHSREDLANFVRARVKDGNTVTGASETRFDGVHVKADPTKTLTIEIRSAPIAGEYRSEMVINDVSGLPAEPGLTDEERWRKAGLTPQGKPLDPQHMQ